MPAFQINILSPSSGLKLASTYECMASNPKEEHFQNSCCLRISDEFIHTPDNDPDFL
jgi:hypothetical protein